MQKYPAVPDSLPLARALERSAPLTDLRRRLQDSAARFDAVRDLLPGGLAAHVQPGPVDEEGWSILAANAAVAAKLRQLQPLMESRLLERGWHVCATRIKVQKP